MSNEKTKALGNRKINFPASEASWAAVDFTRQTHPLAAQFFIYFILAFLISALIYASMAKMALNVQGTGRLVSENPPVPVKPTTQMRVAAVLVKENDFVKSGQILVRSQEDLSEQDVALLKKYLESLKNIQTIYSETCPTCLNQLRETSQLYLANKVQGEMISVLTPIQDLTREMTSALENYSQIPNLVADQELTIKTNLRKLIEIRKRNSEAILAREVESLQAEIATAKAKIDDRKNSGKQRIMALKDQLGSRISELSNKLEYLSSVFTVNAPFDGQITKVKVKGQGEVLTAGQTLMEIIPSNSQLIAELEVQNKDISQLQEGMTVEVEIDALPELDYGTVKGTILQISRSTVGDAGNTSFIVNVKLESQSLSKNGVVTPFMMGMTLKGRILVQYESILKVAIKALFQIKEDVKRGNGSI